MTHTVELDVDQFSLPLQTGPLPDLLKIATSNPISTKERYLTVTLANLTGATCSNTVLNMSTIERLSY